ncbi:DUF6228 family protein [Streptomycetaceae bacterium NBC_01309]
MRTPDAQEVEPSEVTIRCLDDPATVLRLTHRYRPDESGIGFAVEVRAEGLQARVDGVEVWVWDEPGLADFFVQVAADFRGWHGERTWQTNHLKVSAVARTGGHVGLTWTLRPRLTRDAPWESTVTTWIEAGEQAKNLAADIRDFLALEHRDHA